MQQDERGFTLMETLVALFIMVAATTILYRGVAGGLRAAAVAEGQERALSLAKARLAAAGVEFALQPGLAEGAEDDIAWTVETRPYKAGDNGSTDGQLQFQGQAPQRNAYWVTVTVGWRDSRSGQSRSLHLTTLKLGRAS